ncbi:hypothetical protein ASPZODRAFT_470574 [Penicilliopsis zonata CBS 506.65]|uniref:Uncharacterized protein n=1 Tax=Penicilliopsis zonata CBS 506.65 TaxID=1073090 RepID=A0A1L9SXQ4_9EURO|nr:hypothetical protein ASPZODRAFT_470574 [Penicilliopsis zonata CBS 506.65]OJJ51833.1 hypothetical protein ASPZODRAFT_470574 [Penicilliopsis zonata CBS 506.65]
MAYQRMSPRDEALPEQPATPRWKRFLHWRNLLGILWLAPAIALLLLNFQGYIIGAGLACRGACGINVYSATTVQQTRRLDQGNRDVLGALQLVAKLIELWFQFIAGSMVVSIAMGLSHRPGVPMSLFAMYAEFLDGLYLHDFINKVWRALRSRGQFQSHSADDDDDDNSLQVSTTTALIANTTGADGKPASLEGHRGPLYAFLALAGVLALAGSLMGVATAILVLPSLQYIDINRHAGRAFNGTQGATPPGTLPGPYCSAAALARGGYACTGILYAASLDGMVDAANVSIGQAEYQDGSILPPVCQEGMLSFSFNTSLTGSSLWTPSRQVLRALSVDYEDWLNSTTSSKVYRRDRYPDSFRFNHSLATQLQRVGPSIGIQGDCYGGNQSGVTQVELAAEQFVRCYGNITLDEEYEPLATPFTRCIPWGRGWNESAAFSSASFTLNDSYPRAWTADSQAVQVQIYSTPVARYIPSDQINVSSSPSRAYWETLFASPAPDNTFWNMSSYSQTFEYSMASQPESLIWCDSASFLSFATYTLNPTQGSNLLLLVQLEVDNTAPSVDPSSDNKAAIPIDAAWFLAGWSANANGSVAATRSAAQGFIDMYYGAIDTGDVVDAFVFILLHEYSVLHTMSLVTHETRAVTTAAQRSAQARLEARDPGLNAMLRSWATVQMWRYSLGSATSIFGVVIMVIGVVVTLLRTALFLRAPQENNLVVTALLYAPESVRVNGLPLRVKGGGLFPVTQ